MYKILMSVSVLQLLGWKYKSLYFCNDCTSSNKLTCIFVRLGIANIPVKFNIARNIFISFLASLLFSFIQFVLLKNQLV